MANTKRTMVGPYEEDSDGEEGLERSIGGRLNIELECRVGVWMGLTSELSGEFQDVTRIVC